MKLKSITGRELYRNLTKYKVDWNGKSRSKIQEKVKEVLKQIWGNNIVYEEMPVYGTKYSIDFYNSTLDIAIEVQGRQHTEFSKFFHNDNVFNFEDQLRRDRVKRLFCEMNEISLIEIFEVEKLKIDKDFIEELIKKNGSE